MKSDAELVRQTLGGERASYDELVRRHYKTALAVCFGITANREDSQDLVQDTFLRCFERLAEVREPERFSHYLVTAARHAALNLVKRRRRLQQKASTIRELYGDDFRSSESGAGEAVNTEMREAIRRQLQRVPTKSREVVCLFYFDQRPTPEIAEFLGISEAAVRKRLEYGRNSLKAALEKEIEPAIQDDKQRNAHLGIVLANLRTVPVQPARQEVHQTQWPRRRAAAAFAAILCGIVALLLAPRYWPTRFDANTAVPPPRSVPPEETRGAESPLRALDGNRTDAGPSSGLSADATANTGIAGRVVRIGPPPYALNPAQLAFLRDVASSLADSLEARFEIGSVESGATSSAVGSDDIGDVLLLDNNAIAPERSLLQFHLQGQLLPLTEFVSDPEFDMEDFFPNLWRAATIEGEVIGVPVLVRSWALAINTNYVDLDPATLASGNWPALFEHLASRLDADRQTGPTGGNYLEVPASWLWDSILLEAGGGYDDPAVVQSAAWQSTRREFERLYASFPSMLPTTTGRPQTAMPRYFQLVTDGLSGRSSLNALREQDDAWAVIAPSAPTSVVASDFTLAAIRRSTPEAEFLAWEFIKELVSKERMAELARQHQITPYRESVAAQVSDPDVRVFTNQVRAMVFPKPNDVAARNLAESHRQIEETIGLNE